MLLLLVVVLFFGSGASALVYQVLQARGDALRQLGVTSFGDLKRRYVAGPAEMRAFVGDGPILTDDLPLVEYFLSLPRDKRIDIRGLRGDVESRVAK